MRRQERWLKIARGKIKDDYTNHALSHFGEMVAMDCSFKNKTELDREEAISKNHLLNIKIRAVDK